MSLVLCHWASLSYLPEIPDVEEVKGFKQLAFLHAKYLAACHQEGPDVLQAQELGKDRRGSSVTGLLGTVQIGRHARVSWCVIVILFSSFWYHQMGSFYLACLTRLRCTVDCRTTAVKDGWISIYGHFDTTSFIKMMYSLQKWDKVRKIHFNRVRAERQSKRYWLLLLHGGGYYKKYQKKF